MNSIAIFSLGHLTDEQQADYLALSKVGNAEWLESGNIDKYNRLRNIDLADIPEAWTFPDRLEDEEDSDYISRVRVVVLKAFSDLKQGNILAIWLSESGHDLLSQQPEFIAL